MHMKIKEITMPDQKRGICDHILRSLPSWFGVENSIVEYVSKVKELPFFTAFDGDIPVGFIALQPHNQYTAEICVMGVLTEYHRMGIGRSLIEQCESYCREASYEFLTVKTLDGSRASKSYEKTRLFYAAMGFKPLEVFPLFWDADNPCLFIAKHLGRK